MVEGQRPSGRGGGSGGESSSETDMMPDEGAGVAFVGSSSEAPPPDPSGVSVPEVISAGESLAESGPLAVSLPLISSTGEPVSENSSDSTVVEFEEPEAGAAEGGEGSSGASAEHDLRLPPAGSGLYLPSPTSPKAYTTAPLNILDGSDSAKGYATALPTYRIICDCGLDLNSSPVSSPNRGSV